MPVNLIVDFADGRFGAGTAERAVAAARDRGYRLERCARIDDRLAAWIDWQFAPSWWSAEARAGDVWYALDKRGDFAGFAAIDVHGLRFPWLRPYQGARDIGLFGPFGVAERSRKTGLGTALLDVALASLRAKGYARALIPAVGYESLVEMYAARTGATVADRYAYAPARPFRATILASGGGTNAQHVLDGVSTGRLPLDVRGVITNVARAGVIERARTAGVTVDLVHWERTTQTRAAFDQRVIDAVAATEPELVLLLGWMHLLPPAFIERFSELLNVHPAFLPFDPDADDVVLPDGSVMPAFRGAHAVRDALAARSPWVGVSVHRVTSQVDRGAIVVRTPLRLPDAAQDAAAVGARLRPLEHAAVAAAIRRWSFERAARD